MPNLKGTLTEGENFEFSMSFVFEKPLLFFCGRNNRQNQHQSTNFYIFYIVLEEIVVQFLSPFNPESTNKMRFVFFTPFIRWDFGTVCFICAWCFSKKQILSRTYYKSHTGKSLWGIFRGTLSSIVMVQWKMTKYLKGN